MISGTDKIKASVLVHSIGPQNQELITFFCSYPKFVHSEHMRHRAGSYCVSSSRAIPVSRNLEIVRSDDLRAEPVWWGREQKGMASGDELSDLVPDKRVDGGTLLGYGWSPKGAAQDVWKDVALMTANFADELVHIGVHKSIVNRILEPFLPVNVVMTIARPGLLNFFGLRLDKAAQPEIRVLAEKMWAVWNESHPQKLEPGEWHLPYADDEETFDKMLSARDGIGDWTETLQKVSAARCARTSYQSHETGKRSTVEEDLALADRLMAMRHWSPFEHQATPDTWRDYLRPVEQKVHGKLGEWTHQSEHGNLPCWRQWRKMMADEAIAPLPEEYEL